MNTITMSYSLNDLEKIVAKIYPFFEKYPVMTFSGSLGAGKTTLIQALLQKARVEGPIQSPTFAYLNVYQTRLWPKIYHFDLYRLRTQEDFVMAGFDEYLYQMDTKALIEWPEIIMPLLKHGVCHIELDYDGLEQRKIKIVCE